MRVLLDKECAAVAGGHESECVRKTTMVGIATGAAIGAAAGAAAGGVGAIPGAVAGAGVGSLVAQVVAPPLCRWAEKQESEGEESDNETEGPSGNPFRSPTAHDLGIGGNSSMDLGAPLQLVVNSDY